MTRYDGNAQSIETKYNVVVVGKTGVGKSSFINYIYGENICATGIGKPVTVKGFHATETKIGKIPMVLFDSMGLEAGKADEWYSDLKAELVNRGTDKSVEQWFHSVFYCIAASGSRLEPFETKIIKEFLDQKYKVVVVLTKADMIREEDEEELKKVIRLEVDEKIRIISICSKGEVRRGYSVQPFGLENVMKEIDNGFWDSITARLPERCIKAIYKNIDNWHENKQREIRQKIGENIFGVFQINLSKETKQYLEDLKGKIIPKIIENEITKTLSLYSDVADTIQHLHRSLLQKQLEAVTNNNIISELEYFESSMQTKDWRYHLSTWKEQGIILSGLTVIIAAALAPVLTVIFGAVLLMFGVLFNFLEGLTNFFRKTAAMHELLTKLGDSVSNLKIEIAKMQPTISKIIVDIGSGKIQK